MAQQNSDLAVSTLKQNIDASLRMIEVITAATRKMHETQLKAVADMQASTETFRKQFEHASNPEELWRIQSEWMSGGMQKSLNYWQEFFEAAAQVQSSISNLSTAPSEGSSKPSRHAH